MFINQSLTKVCKLLADLLFVLDCKLLADLEMHMGIQMHMKMHMSNPPALRRPTLLRPSRRIPLSGCPQPADPTQLPNLLRRVQPSRPHPPSLPARSPAVLENRPAPLSIRRRTAVSFPDTTRFPSRGIRHRKTPPESFPDDQHLSISVDFIKTPISEYPIFQ